MIGGFVVRDPGLPTLLGRYLFGDQSKGTLLSAALGSDTTPRVEGSLPVGAPTSLGEDACGHVYVAQGGGAVSRIDDVPGAPCAGGPAVAPVAPAPGWHRRARLRAAGPRRRGSSRAGRVKLRLRARRACTVTLRARGFRLRRVSLRAGRARTVRITPTRKRLRRLERGDRVKRVRIRVRTRDARRRPRGPAGPGARPLTARGGGATLLVAPPPLSESFRAPSLGSDPQARSWTPSRRFIRLAPDIRPFHRTNVQTPDFRSVGWVRRRGRRRAAPASPSSRARCGRGARPACRSRGRPTRR